MLVGFSAAQRARGGERHLREKGHVEHLLRVLVAHVLIKSYPYLWVPHSDGLHDAWSVYDH